MVLAYFSPDGERVLTCSLDTTARLWRTKDGSRMASMPHAGAVQMGTWSADGRRILTCAAGCEARLWDADGEPVATLRGHRDRVAFGSFSPDGRMVATGSWDGEILVWDVDNRDFLEWRGHRADVRLACLTPDRLLTVAADGEARLWKDGGPPVVQTTGQPVDVAVSSRGGGQLLTTHAAKIRLWEVGSSGLAKLTEISSMPLALGACFAPDASRFALLAGMVARECGRPRAERRS